MRPVSRHIPLLRTGCLWLLCLLWAEGAVRAQCLQPVRKYADQAVFQSGNVTDPSKAIDKELATAATLGLTSSKIWLQFDEKMPAGTRVFVKLSNSFGGVALFPTITIEGYYKASGNTRVSIPNEKIQINQALGLLTGEGTLELSLVPDQGFDGVAISLSGIGLGYQLKVYDAYVLRETTTPLACNGVTDILHGALPALGLPAASDVSDPWNAVDASLLTYAHMKMALGVGGSVYETVIFNAPSVAGDSVSIMLSREGGSLLDLMLLGGFSIQPYLGTTAVGPAITNTSTGLQLRLLAPGGSTGIFTAAVPTPFDRVEIKLSAIAGVLLELKLYDITRVARQPVVSFTLNGGAVPNPVCITQTSQLFFSVTNPEACGTYRWYNGSAPAGTGPSLVPQIAVAGSYTFYVEAQRGGCTNAETRAAIPVNVAPKAGPPTLTIQNNP